MKQLISRKLTVQIAKPHFKEFVHFPKSASSSIESSSGRLFPKDKWFIKNALCSLFQTWKDWVTVLDTKCGVVAKSPPPDSDGLLDPDVMRYKAWTFICLVRRNINNVQQSKGFKNIMKTTTAAFTKYEDLASDFLERTFTGKKK